eukprot:789326_1
MEIFLAEDNRCSNVQGGTKSFPQLAVMKFLGVLSSGGMFLKTRVCDAFQQVPCMASSSWDRLRKSLCPWLLNLHDTMIRSAMMLEIRLSNKKADGIALWSSVDGNYPQIRNARAGTFVAIGWQTGKVIYNRTCQVH